MQKDGEKALVSIIVPIYKVEQYLDEAIESLVRQTYSNIEIILVDDGSPDNCGKMCDEWAKKDGRIRVIHQQNAGISMARNVGIEASNGKYLMFVDSDDFVEVTCVEDLYSAISETNADMAVAGIVELKEDGSRSFIKATESEREEIDMLTALLRMEKSGQEKGAYIIVTNKIYRRELWDTLQFPEGKIYEDAFVMPEVYCMCNKIAVINSCVYIYRKREGSITAEKKEKYAHFHFEMLEHKERIYDKIGIKELVVLYQIHLYREYEYYHMDTKEIRKQIQKKLRKYFFSKRYTTKISFSRKVKNFMAVISLPMYHNIIARVKVFS